MDIGSLRHRITIEEATETLTSIGEVTQTWATFATVWAKVEPLNGREYWQSAQINSEITGKITIRYLEDITTKMRIKFGSRIFNIEAILNSEEKNKEMTLLIKEQG